MRLLFLAHNHPDLQPGGTEALARGLFRELCDQHGAKGLFLAATHGTQRERRPGTLLQPAGTQPDELLISLDRFDRFFLSQPDAAGLMTTLLPLVENLRPDVIHIHHPLQFGLETIDLLRRAAPRAAMVLTLHDYFALCPREGQLLTAEGRLCTGPTLDTCRRCLPSMSANDLALRDVALRDACRAFDGLLAPSCFLRDRFVAAGWDAARIEVLPNGIVPATPAPHREAARRDRFGFFGHVNRFKGALVALRASTMLLEAEVPHRLSLHGGTAWQSPEFLAEFADALREAPAARHHGAYTAAELPALMAEVDWVVVPSVWWENSPLVVLEAFRHRRPVICSGVGGMAELVRNGVDGLHAKPGDPQDLAAVMRRAIEEEGLWSRLVEGLRPPRSISDVALLHLDYYRTLRSRPRSARRRLH